MNYAFRGIVQNQRLKIYAKKTFETALLTFPEGTPLELTLRKETKKRTDPQNRYYWGVIIKMLGDYFGYEPEEMHEALKMEFLKVNGPIPTVKSTTKLTTVEFNDYIGRIIRWAAMEYGVVLPDPNEVELDDSGMALRV